MVVGIPDPKQMKKSWGNIYLGGNLVEYPSWAQKVGTVYQKRNAIFILFTRSSR